MTKVDERTSTKVPSKKYTKVPPRTVSAGVIIKRDSLFTIPDAAAEAESTAIIQSHFRSLRTTDICSATASKYRQCLKSYASWLKSRPISDQAAREFLLELRDQGFANATIRFYYHALKPLLLTQGINLSLKFKKRTKLPPYHSVNQVKAILSTVENRSGKWSQLADRDWLMIAILAYTGIRRGELLALRPRDIDLFAKTIRIQGKGDKERIIPIHQLLYKPLKFYTASMPPHHYLFPFKPKRAWQIVVNYARQAGIPDFHPHAFRHFFATQLVEQGVSLHIIKELLGHADISTTAIYLDVLPKHLENAVHTLPDLSQEGEKR